MVAIKRFVYLLFLFSIPSSIYAQTFTKISPTSGSWVGNTDVYLSGTNLGEDLYTFPVSVFIGSIPCDVDWLDTSRETIHCVTRPFTRSLLEVKNDPLDSSTSIALEVTVVRAGVPIVCDPACTFTYAESETPTVDSVVANEVTPLTVVTMSGNTRLSGEVEWTDYSKVSVGDARCAPRLNTAPLVGGDVQGLTDDVSLFPIPAPMETETTVTYPVIGVTEDSVSCQVMTVTPGHHNATYTTSRGGALPSARALKVGSNNELYSVSVFPHITSVSPSVIPTTGGRTITLQGGGFGSSAEDILVSVGDAPCEVTKRTAGAIECTVPAQPSTSVNGANGRGVLTEIFHDVAGSSVSDLVGSASYPASPSVSIMSTSMSHSNETANYGTRMRAIFIVPFNATYNFAIAGDDQAELYISPDGSAANAVKAAEVTSPTSSYSRTEQSSSDMVLTAGNAHYMEVRHKQGSGSGHVTVAMFVHDTPYGSEYTSQAADEKQRITISATERKEVQRVSIDAAAATQFRLEWDGQQSALLGVASSASDVADAVNGMLSWECSKSGGSAMYDTDTFESATEWTRTGGDTVETVIDTAFCGKRSLHIHDGRARNFNGGSNLEGDQTSDGFNTVMYQQICMAYRVPADTVVNMIINIAGLGWHSIALTGTPNLDVGDYRYPLVATWPGFEADNLWHFGCVDIQAQIEASLGTSENSILGIELHPPVSSSYPEYGGELWIDEFYVARSARSVVQTSVPVRPNGIIVTSATVQTVASPAAGRIEYDVEMSFDGCANYVFSLMTTSDSAVASVSSQDVASAPLGNTFVMNYNGNPTAAIDTGASAQQIAAALQSVDGVGRISVNSRTSTCYVRSFDITFLSGGNRPTLSVDTSSTTGESAAATVSVLENGGLWIAPVPSEFFMAVTDLPNANSRRVSLSVNGVRGICTDSSTGFCVVEYDASINPPTVTGVTPTSAAASSLSIVVDGTNFVSGSTVTVGGYACAVTATSATQITCDTAAALPAGSHLIVVYNSNGKGQSASAIYTRLMTVDSVTPSAGSVGGSQDVTVSGSAFGSAPADVSVLIDGVACNVVRAEDTIVVCKTGVHAAASSLDVVVAHTSGVQQTLAGAYEYSASMTPTVTNVTPTTGLATGGVLLTVQGSLFDTTASNNIVTFGGKDCPVVSATATEITCNSPPVVADVVAVVNVISSTNGAATVTPASLGYTGTLRIDGVSAFEGSVFGGHSLTISGVGFSNGAAEVLVGGSMCSISSQTDTEIVCETGNMGTVHVVDNNARNSVYGLGYLWNPSSLTIDVGDTIYWLWTATRYTTTTHAVVQLESAATEGSMVPAAQYGFMSKSSPDGSFNHTFSAPGVYHFASDLYRNIGMGGVVTVRDDAARPIADVSPISVTINGVEAVHNSANANTANSGYTPSSCLNAPSGTVNLFRYGSGPCTTPRVTSFTPTQGASGSTLTISGSNFESGATTVVLRSYVPAAHSNETVTPVDVACAIISENATSIECTVGAISLGKHEVVVTTASQGTARLEQANRHFLAAPVVTAISHVDGSVAAGHLVTFTGSDIRPSPSGAVKVMIGNTECDVDATTVSPTSFVCATRSPLDHGYSAAILRDSPVAYWKLDSRTGDNLGTSGGRGNAVVGVNGAADGIIGHNNKEHAMQFNERSEHVVSASGSIGTDMSTTFSVEFWANATTHDDTHWWTPRVVLAHINNTDSLECYNDCKSAGFMVVVNCGKWEFWVARNESLAGNTTSPDPSSCTPSAPSTGIRSYGDSGIDMWKGSWEVMVGPPADGTRLEHIVATYDLATGQMELYVDGGLAVTHTQVGAPAYAPAAASINVNLGGVQSINTVTMKASYAGLFRGTIDEVALYGHKLSSAQVTEHYHYGSTLDQPISVSYEEYDFHSSGFVNIPKDLVNHHGTPYEHMAHDHSHVVQPDYGEFKMRSASVPCANGGGRCAYAYRRSLTPVLTLFAPASLGGGDTLTIHGTEFDSGSVTVTVGGYDCPVTLNNAAGGVLECTMPALQANDHGVVVNFQLVGNAAHDSGSLGYDDLAGVYDLPLGGQLFQRHRLAIAAVSPTAGSTAGGTVLTLSGHGFNTNPTDNTIAIGGAACVVSSATLVQIVCTTSALSASTHPVAISVATAAFNADSPASSTFEYSAAATPTIASVTPSAASAGTTITVTGSFLMSSPTVRLEGGAAGSFACPNAATVSASTVECVVPEQPGGTYDVIVHASGFGLTHNTHSIAHSLSAAPSSSPVSSAFGGGSVVVVSGSGLPSLSADANVAITCPSGSGSCKVLNNYSYAGFECVLGSYLGGSAATHAVSSASDVTGAADVSCDMVVTVPGGASITLSSVVNYVASTSPIVSSISKSRGGTGGGTVVTIDGQNFGTVVADTTVTLAGVNCVVSSVTSTQVVCTTDAAGLITVKGEPVVTIANVGSSRPLTSAGEFEFVDVWSSPYSWGGGPLPVAGDTVVIPRGRKMLLDMNTPVLNVLLIEGEFEFDRRDLTLDANYILVNEGKFSIGSEAEPFTYKATITMHGFIRDTELPIFGNKVLAVRHGELNLHGANRTHSWTQLEGDVLPGATSITVGGLVDWVGGESIAIAPTGRNHKEHEQRTIVSVVHNSAAGTTTIGLDQPLAYAHDGRQYTYGGKTLDMRAEVGLLSRNVVIQGKLNTEDPDYNDGGPPDRHGSQVMVFGTTIMKMSYVEVRNSGQAFKMGRYSVHFHHTHSGWGSYIHGCAIHHTFNRAITNHQVQGAIVSHNVAYHIQGHSYFLEDGGEVQNTYDSNLGIYTFPSMSLLNTDQLPAVFWITNPSNTYINNHAAGSASHGMWIKLDGRPVGHLNSHLCPDSMPLGVFDNNNVHSAEEFGFRIWEGYMPKSNPDGCSGSLIPAEFTRTTTYGNGKGIEFTIVGELRIIDTIAADNAGSNIEILEVFGRWGGPMIDDTVVVAEVFDSVAMASNPPSTTGIKTPNKMKLTVRNVSFHHFSQSGSAALRACSFCKFRQGGMETRFMQLQWIDSPNRIAWKWEHEALFYDIDGTLTGQSGAWATPWNPMLPDTTCSTNAGMSLGIPGSICDSSMTFRRIAWNRSYPSSLNGRDVIVTAASTGRSTTIPWRHYRLTHMDGYMLTVYTSESYDVKWDLPSTSVVDPTFYNGGIYELQPNDWFNWRMDFLQTPDHWHINSDTTPSASLPDPASSPHGEWHFDSTLKRQTILVSGINGSPTAGINGQASGGVTRGLSYTLHSCPDDGCPMPLPPGLGSFTGTLLYWCNPLSWPTGQVPVDGEDVTIPGDVRMVVDCDTAKLDRVTVFGMIEIMNGKDLTFTANNIFLRGGYFVAGTETEPFTKTATIRLTGNRTTPDWAIDNTQNMASKAIGVYGHMSLVGKARNARWTRLASTAAAGSSVINVVIPAGGLDWVVGDDIMIASSTYNSNEAEVRTITAVSGNAITVNSPLVNIHTVSSGQYSAGFASEVALLTRNVRVVGADLPAGSLAVENFGARILVGSAVIQGQLLRGRMTMRDVEMQNHGQRGWFDPEDPRYGVAFLDVGNYGQFSSVKSCVFRNGYSNGIGAFGSSDIALHDNVIHSTYGSGIRTTGPRMDIRRNLVALQIVHFPNPSDSHIVDESASFEVSGRDSIVVDNAAAGSERYGFRISGEACSTGGSNNPAISRNTAHSNSWGMRLDGVATTVGDCTAVQDFTTWKNWNYGIWGHTRSSVELRRVQVGDSKVGLDINVFGPDLLLHLTAPKTVQIWDSSVVGTTPEEAADCASVYLPPNPDQKSFEVGLNKTGVMIGAFTRSKITMAPFIKVKSYPAINGETVLNNVTFVNFNAGVCGRSRDFAITTNPEAPDAQHPVTLTSGTQAINTDADCKVHFHNPKLEWINPTDCVDMDCDGPKHALIRDETGGSFSGVSSPLTTYVPYAELRFDNAKIPAEYVTTQSGDRLPVDDVVKERGVARKNNDGTGSCSFDMNMNAYTCQDLSHRMLVYESMDFDTETRRLSPVSLSTDAGTTDLLNGPMDHGWCSYYTCLKRVSTMFGLVATGNNYTMHLTGTEPAHSRFHLLNTPETESIRMAYYITRPERVDVYVNNVYIEPMNAQFLKTSDAPGVVEKRWAKSYIPMIDGNVAGTNYFDRFEKMLYVVLRGGSNAVVDIVRSKVIQVSLTLAVSVNDFFEVNLISNLAFLLNIDPESIRVMDVVPETNQTPLWDANWEGKDGQGLRGSRAGERFHTSAATSDATKILLNIGAEPVKNLTSTDPVLNSNNNDPDGFDNGDKDEDVAREVFQIQVAEYNREIAEIERLNDIGASVARAAQTGEIIYPVNMLEMASPKAPPAPVVPNDIEGQANLPQPKEYKPPANGDTEGNSRPFRIPSRAQIGGNGGGSSNPRATTNGPIPEFSMTILDSNGDPVTNLGYGSEAWTATVTLKTGVAAQEQSILRAMSRRLFASGLSGTTTVTFEDGTATFNDVTVNEEGTHTLEVTSSSGGYSNTYTVTVSDNSGNPAWVLPVSIVSSILFCCLCLSLVLCCATLAVCVPATLTILSGTVLSSSAFCGLGVHIAACASGCLSCLLGMCGLQRIQPGDIKDRRVHPNGISAVCEDGYDEPHSVRGSPALSASGHKRVGSGHSRSGSGHIRMNSLTEIISSPFQTLKQIKAMHMQNLYDLDQAAADHDDGYISCEEAQGIQDAEIAAEKTRLSPSTMRKHARQASIRRAIDAFSLKVQRLPPVYQALQRTDTESSRRRRAHSEADMTPFMQSSPKHSSASSDEETRDLHPRTEAKPSKPGLETGVPVFQYRLDMEELGNTLVKDYVSEIDTDREGKIVSEKAPAPSRMPVTRLPSVNNRDLAKARAPKAITISPQAASPGTSESPRSQRSGRMGHRRSSSDGGALIQLGSPRDGSSGSD